MYAFEITEVMGSRISDFSFFYESNGSYGKIEHEIGLKLWPSLKSKILM